jgi:hypothetical protein
MAKKEHLKYDAQELRGVRASNMLPMLRLDGMSRRDSADDAALWFARQLDFVKNAAYDVLYPELTALANFPVTHDVNPGAETVTYRSYDKTGEATVVANFADDIPRADILARETTSKIVTIADSYGYNVQDMRNARYAQRPIEVAKAESARYAIDRRINEIAWVGDSVAGINGVLSADSGIQPNFVAVKWSEKTPEEIVADIKSWYNQIVETTHGVERPDTLLLPSGAFANLSMTPMQNLGVANVLEFIKRSAPFLKENKEANELDAESPLNDKLPEDRKGGKAFLFTNNDRKLSLEIPMMFYQNPAQFHNLETTIICEARTAGALVYYPMSALIAVGI